MVEIGRRKAKPLVSKRAAKDLLVVGKEVPEKQGAARAEDPENLLQGDLGFRGVVQDHVGNDSVDFTVPQGQLGQVTEPELDLGDFQPFSALAGLLEHGRRGVYSEDAARTHRQLSEEPACTAAQVEDGLSTGEGLQKRRDAAVRTQPGLLFNAVGKGVEEVADAQAASLPHLLQASPLAGSQPRCIGVDPSPQIDRSRGEFVAPGVKRQPPLPSAHEHARVNQDAQVPRNRRLGRSQDLNDLVDVEAPFAQQTGQAETSAIGKRLDQVDRIPSWAPSEGNRRFHGSIYIDKSGFVDIKGESLETW